ncbi:MULTISPECIES: hypothetical protein [unclassified Chryseobacterium]|uniref:hypothetical protein n=1 Tax=unclassified Chryseobacterium TaxID=2593645 RepID=UPI000D3A8B53|nr:MULTISPECIES: hypothetical protein [unclassified Chryseobacterium]PTT68618.1 hypothetical protein DBR25_20000 [Chryseobacterium sp. HMWF001]PVV54765.1 hypothetical protein DD829_17425 [Chryseobacterium sp. HMWF035]
MAINLTEKLNLLVYDTHDPKYIRYCEKIFKHTKNNEVCFSGFINEPDFKTFLNSLQSQLAEIEDSIVVDPKTELSLTLFNTLSDIIVYFPLLIDFIKKNNHPEILQLFIRISILIEIHQKTVASIKGRKLLLRKEELQLYMEKKILFSQSEIAREWEIDKETLSKWLTMIYGENPYKGRKKLSFSEYIGIYKDLFKGKSHHENAQDYFLTEENIDAYSSVVFKGKTYTKQEMIELGFSLDDEPSPRQYSEARKILLKKFPGYDAVNKYPVSIAQMMINLLKEHS